MACRALSLSPRPASLACSKAMSVWGCSVSRCEQDRKGACCCFGSLELEETRVSQARPGGGKRSSVVQPGNKDMQRSGLRVCAAARKRTWTVMGHSKRHTWPASFQAGCSLDAQGPSRRCSNEAASHGNLSRIRNYPRYCGSATVAGTYPSPETVPSELHRASTQVPFCCAFRDRALVLQAARVSASIFCSPCRLSHSGTWATFCRMAISGPPP